MSELSFQNCKFFKNPKTGQVVAANPSLRLYSADMGLVPYAVPPAAKETTKRRGRKPKEESNLATATTNTLRELHGIDQGQ